jgi:hypothetical protein
VAWRPLFAAMFRVLPPKISSSGIPKNGEPQNIE